MQLRVQTTPALIGIKTTNAQLNMRRPDMKIEGQNTFAQVQVEMTLPKVKIDQTQAFNESGLKTQEAFAAENVQIAWQEMYKGIADNAEQGRALTEIHKGGNPIASQASYNAFELFNHTFGMVTMPKSGPDIQVEEGMLDIEVIEGETNKHFTFQKNRSEYIAGKVETYLRQKHSIQISFEGDKLDLSV